MKVHIEFDKEGIRNLDAIKKMISVKTRTEVIKNSIAVFSWISQQIADGFNIIALKEGESYGRELCLPILEKLKKRAQEEKPTVEDELKPCPECGEQLPSDAIFCIQCGENLKMKVKKKPGKKQTLPRGITKDEKPREEIFPEPLVTILGNCPLCNKDIVHGEKHFTCEGCEKEFFCENHFHASEGMCLDCLSKLDTLANHQESDAPKSLIEEASLTDMMSTAETEDVKVELEEDVAPEAEAEDFEIKAEAENDEEEEEGLEEAEAEPQIIAPEQTQPEEFREEKTTFLTDESPEEDVVVEIVSEPTPPPPEEIKPVEIETAIITVGNSQMVLISAGDFLMGSNQGYKGEGPEHKVFLDAYYIDQYPVTNTQFKVYMKETKAPPPKNFWEHPDFKGENQPVIGVSWNEASEYCKWAGKRMPTEAEWEKAARGPNGNKYPWGNEWVPNNCNSLETGIKKTTPVDTYPNGKSPYGVIDMAGNIYEWCADWYDEAYYEISTYKNPTGPKFSTMKVLRGGSWSNLPGNIRASFRLKSSPERCVQTFGFRCAKEA